MNFCVKCGKKLVVRVPDGDDRNRYVCGACGTVHYSNPKMVVGAIPEYEDRILLCRRAIEPRWGLWTLPAGFMENEESVEEGAKRETLEEAGAELNGLSPFAMFSLPFVSQVYLMFRARLLTPHFAAGHESLDVKLVSEAEIPWDEIAFPVIEETLRLFLADRKKGAFGFHSGIINRRI
ncbi:MAG: NUDIX hydrolase [Desulfobacterales bacterium]|nr:NUDIX hydrolase [Desulfobacterales bacterium]MCF8078771.1 NUDIX hydrolase [Desulfobacterales bacterium]